MAAATQAYIAYALFVLTPINLLVYIAARNERKRTRDIFKRILFYKLRGR